VLHSPAQGFLILLGLALVRGRFLTPFGLLLLSVVAAHLGRGFLASCVLVLRRRLLRVAILQDSAHHTNMFS